MFFGQETIFGPKVISTIGYDEQEIIRDILCLHADSNIIDCDPTYSIGNFYKKGIPPPKLKYDKFPQIEGVVEATSDSLPLGKDSVSVIMFDPPFVISGEGYDDLKEGSGIISKRFTAFKDFKKSKCKVDYSGN